MEKKIQIRMMDSISEESIKLTDLCEKYKDFPDAVLTIDRWYDDTQVSVEYFREETDEEFEKRMKILKQFAKANQVLGDCEKEERRKLYEKLKAEFEA